LGGPALVGLKTPIAIVAYALLYLLQSAGSGPAFGSTTNTVLTTLIATFGGLGVSAKFDRGVQALSAIAGILQKLPTLTWLPLPSTNGK
jgi:hypothetical protein